MLEASKETVFFREKNSDSLEDQKECKLPLMPPSLEFLDDESILKGAVS